MQNLSKRSDIEHQIRVSIECKFLIFWKHEFRSSSDMEKSIRTSGQPSRLGTRHTTTLYSGYYIKIQKIIFTPKDTFWYPFNAAFARMYWLDVVKNFIYGLRYLTISQISMKTSIWHTLSPKPDPQNPNPIPTLTLFFSQWPGLVQPAPKQIGDPMIS